MGAQGLKSLYPLDTTAVMGLREVVPRIPAILARVREASDFALATRPNAVVLIDNEKALKWLRNGAQPTDTVERLLKISGAWDEFTEHGDFFPNTPGVAVEALPLLHDLGVCAIACDNWAVEQLTGGEPFFPVHELALVYMGMLLGENFELDALADACSAAGRYEFFFAGQPLPIVGGVGGPVNPIAVL